MYHRFIGYAYNQKMILNSIIEEAKKVELGHLISG